MNVKRMFLVIVCALLTANLFAIGKKTSKQQQQEEESSSEETTSALMETLRAMKPGDNYVNSIRMKGSGLMNIRQLYTRVGGGFIVQTFDFKSETGSLVSNVTTISSVFVSDREMFGD